VTSVANRRFTLIVLCAIFLADGIVMAAIGPTLPDLARQTGRSLGEVGRVFIAVFGGSLLAQVLGGPISDRFGRRVVLVLGLLLFGVGAAGMAASHRMLWLLSAAIVAGIGYGGCTLAVNVIASEIAPERRASTVNLVNLFYAMGAIAGPLIAGALIEARGSALATLGIGSALLLLLVPISLRGVAIDHTRRDVHETADTRAVGVGLDAATPFIAALGLLLALYVGSEASLGAWAPVYLQQSTPLDAAGATTATAAFWVAPARGRARRRVRQRRGAGGARSDVRTDLPHRRRHRDRTVRRRGWRGDVADRAAGGARRDGAALAAGCGPHPLGYSDERLAHIGRADRDDGDMAARATCRSSCTRSHTTQVIVRPRRLRGRPSQRAWDSRLRVRLTGRRADVVRRSSCRSETSPSPNCPIRSRAGPCPIRQFPGGFRACSQDWADWD
jgi:MFS family permease